ncbi:polysaccharide deacetylase family protein [Alicyclobacillus sp. SO9]|uniref:polysaccharide deacetylase family protein n=1 Tax=Alicyclobacillus sp. SO9 TaxID=2665646 RepID=UPI0018E7521E|nr:polysaccharide deacetylase family protein [Alicyclobacillus sp. SO9]QQE77889.1 polysaccharide deacetylase family protein [Alicyclobacillus sp. SO9]
MRVPTSNDDVTMKRLPSNGKVLALTFDDGPDSDYTPKVLSLLDRYGVHANFFCLGAAVEANPEVARRIVDSGHLIANHTWSHLHSTEISLAELHEEVQRTSAVIQRVTDVQPLYFRPPYGELNAEVSEAVSQWGYRVVLWSVDAVDWSGISGPQIAANVIPNLHHGGILLHHSAGNVSGTVDALPYIIEVCLKMDYRFVRLDGAEPHNVV